MTAAQAEPDRRTFIASLAAGLAGLGSSTASAFVIGDTPEKTITRLLQHPDLAAAAIVMTERGRSVLEYCRGFASPAFEIPVTNATLFNVGSIGKHVTAVAILRLAEQGKLSLGDPLGRHVADLSPDWGRVTIGRILSHTSGLPANFEGQDLDRPFTRPIVSEFSKTIPVVAPPGQAWVYSNVGYVLLGYVIENLTGQAYGEHITWELFRAHGLEDSRADDGEAFLPLRAEPVVFQNGKPRRALQMSREVSSVAAGGLVFSARDVAAWERALSGRDLLSDASKQTMFREARLENGRFTGYGLGWRILNAFRPSPIHFHTGSVPGYSAVHIRIPDRDRAVMVMATGYGPMNGLGLEAADALWPDVSTVSLPAIVDTAPDRTRRIAAFVLDGAPLASLPLASELTSRSPEIAASTLFRLNPDWRGALRGLSLVSDTATPAGRVRRYTIDLGNVRLPLCVVYTPDGAVARISP